jgi:hypothetical protein
MTSQATRDVDVELSGQAYLAPEKRGDIVAGYRLDRGLSNKTTAVYSSLAPGGAPKIAYRGTKGIEDLWPDVAVAVGAPQLSSRFREAESTARAARTKYGVDPSLTGHSLGGSVALRVSKTTGYKSNVFNPGSSVLEKGSVPAGSSVNVKRGDLIASGYDKDPRPVAFRGFDAIDVANTLMNHPLRGFRSEAGGLKGFF